ncbi:hypothetical protein TWF730_001106 [Orbilia blumenaviensis]|uniref:ribonuclease H n=1 Tax=Orbilia blumenaviensis TaxID=1796055 RepID=A0AAV9VRN3_9PEZI
MSEPPNRSGRLWTSCPSIQRLDFNDQFMLCDYCDQFILKCCQHSSSKARGPRKLCHHYFLIFADGSCLGNGKVGARAGVGIALGMEPDQQFAYSFSELDGVCSVRTNQIAELKAAIEAVKLAGTHLGLADSGKRAINRCNPRSRHQQLQKEAGIPKCIIAMDSEYVVLGITDRLHGWKANGYLNPRRTKPINLDLFLELEAAINDFEEKKNGRIRFWYISRKNNKVADRLANIGARLDELV